MSDNHHTPLTDRLHAASIHILQNRTIWKRLRYCRALQKIGKQPTEKQATLLATDILSYLDKQGVTMDDYENNEAIITQFHETLMATAWSEGNALDNFKVLKQARENTK